jgi:methyl-accepting chemotaxis protein
MEYKFKHSLAVMGQLAQNAGLTPPSEYDPPFEYLDRSVEILARICLKHQESLDQREFIASQIREVERKLNGRLRDVEKEMDGRFNVDERFEKVYEEKDEQFDKMDEHFDTMDDSFESMIARLDNAAAVTKDERLGMMYQQDLKPSGDPKFVWASHPQVPKHMKDAYILGQRAKGIFEPSWDGKSNEQSMYCFIYLENTSLLCA